MTGTLAPAVERDLDRLVARSHHDPHSLLGIHPRPGGGVVVRVYRPGSAAPSVVVDGENHQMTEVDPRGLFELALPDHDTTASYRLRASRTDVAYDDPYRFLPSLGDLDLHLLGEGRHRELGRVVGAHPKELDGVRGTSFSVWAPGARGVTLVGDSNGWDDRTLPMRSLGSSGLWELFLPGVEPGMRYKFAVHGADGSLRQHADPLATRTEVPPATASVVFEGNHCWQDDDWMARRADAAGRPGPMSIYEVHPGSWRGPMSWRDLAEPLAEHVTALGFTHVELMAVLEHPFAGSWGYQVTGFFAPTARFGEPDDFRALVDALHRRGSASSSTGCRRTSRATSGPWPASTAPRSTSTTTRVAGSTPTGEP